MSLLRITALLAALSLVTGCGRKPTHPLPPTKSAPLISADETALQQIGQQVLAAVVKGDTTKFRALTVAGLTAAELEVALRKVRENEAHQYISRLEAIPVDQRNELQLDTLRLAKAFVASPKTAFADEWPNLQSLIGTLGKTQLKFFNNQTTTNAPLDWAEAGKPSLVISINPQTMEAKS